MRGADLRPGLDVDMTATGSVDRGDKPSEPAPDEAPPMSQLPPDALPVAYAYPPPHSPARREDSDGEDGDWRPTLAHVLARLGGAAPQARLGCPVFSIGAARALCGPSKSTASSPKAPE